MFGFDGDMQKAADNRQMFGILVFENCAQVARFMYGTTGYLVALSTFLAGYR